MFLSRPQINWPKNSKDYLVVQYQGGVGKYSVANLSVEQILQSFLIELWLIARIKAADRLAPKQRETGKSLQLAAAVTAPAPLL